MRPWPRIGVALFALASLGCVSVGPQIRVSPAQLPALAGFWTGYFVGTSGAGVPADLRVEPDGRYAIIFPSGTSMEGTIAVSGGRLVLENDYISGPAVDLAVASATLELHQKGQRQHLLGFGENDAGPFSFSFGR